MLTPRQIAGLTGLSYGNLAPILSRLKLLDLITPELPEATRTRRYTITPRGRLAVEIVKWAEGELAEAAPV
jgi:DNA-binding PadR family transcriptional regulator